MKTDKISNNTITKSAAEKYIIRGDKISWSVIMLDDEYGDISIQSDWGNFGYIWGPLGRGSGTLKEFLITADIDYIKDKFSYPENGGKNYVYEKESLNNLKKDIITARKEHQLSKKEARSIWKNLNLLDFCGDINAVYYSIEDVVQELNKWKYDIDFWKDGPWDNEYEFMERIVTGCSPQLTFFMNNIWPVFIQEIKKEIKNGQ